MTVSSNVFFPDVPMSVGILNLRSQSSYTNELEFEWDTQVEAQVYIKVKYEERKYEMQT
jgi:hypothetical protein